MNNKENCIICGKPLQYLNDAVSMKCEICGKVEMSKVMCEDKHFVCNSCHSNGIEIIKAICLKNQEKSPYKIANLLMDNDVVHMHGNEHHIIVGAALLTAYYNSGGKIDLAKAIDEMILRGKKVPGGACGYWGACGAGISVGMFISIITNANPLKNKEYGLSNLATSECLKKIGETGGPRCCKRNSFLSINCAIDFVEKYFNIKMEKNKIKCNFHNYNKECIKKRCPFYENNI